MKLSCTVESCDMDDIAQLTSL